MSNPLHVRGRACRRHTTAQPVTAADNNAFNVEAGTRAEFGKARKRSERGREPWLPRHDGGEHSEEDEGHALGVILVPSHSREVLLDVAVGARATHGRKSDVVVTHGDLCRSISCDVDGCTPTRQQLRSTQAASQALRAPRIFARCEILIMYPLFSAFVLVAPKFFEL